MMTKKNARALLDWFAIKKRDLPWRKTKDAYAIWVSEIMLQQTRVEAVKPYYKTWMERYPDVKSLAEAKEDDLVRIWEGLGYYSRVRNMHKAAMEVTILHGGLFPVSYEVLKTLPGIGEYTAGAVASIAGGETVPAADGNVLRVYTRLNADSGLITDAKCVRRIRNELSDCMKSMEKEAFFSPGDFNAALMELGATVCLPNGEPLCKECPLADSCLAKKEGKATEYPKKAPKPKRRIENRTIFIMESPEGIAVRKREEKGLLAGMYEFPGVEGHLTEEEVKEAITSFGYHPVRITRLEDSKHIFSHIEWHMQAYRVVIDGISDPLKEDPVTGIRFVTGEERESGYALPSAFGAYKKYIR